MNETDYELGREMMSYLVTFCKYGDPTPAYTADADINYTPDKFWFSNSGDFRYMDFSGTAQSKTISESTVSAVYKQYGLSFKNKIECAVFLAKTALIYYNIAYE